MPQKNMTEKVWSRDTSNSSLYLMGYNNCLVLEYLPCLFLNQIFPNKSQVTICARKFDFVSSHFLYLFQKT